MRWSGTTEIFFFFNSMSGTRILLFLSFSFHFFFSSFFLFFSLILYLSFSLLSSAILFMYSFIFVGHLGQLAWIERQEHSQEQRCPVLNCLLLSFCLLVAAINVVVRHSGHLARPC